VKFEFLRPFIKKAQLKFDYTESHKVSKKFRECLFWKKSKVKYK